MLPNALMSLLGLMRLTIVLAAVHSVAARIVSWIGRRGGLHLDITDRIVVYIVAGYLVFCLPVLALGLIGLLYPFWLIVTVLALALAARQLLPQPDTIFCLSSTGDTRARRALIPPLLVLLVSVCVFMTQAPNTWDAMTYHLFIPLRWVQEHRLFHVPSVFGDGAEAYYPKNAPVFYAGVMSLLGDDTALNMFWVPMYLAGAAAMAGLVGYLGGGAGEAAIGAGIFLSIPAYLSKAFYAETDMPSLVMFLFGLYFFIGYLMNQERFRALAGSLAMGMAAGFKPLSLIMAAPMLAVLWGSLVWRKKWPDIFLSLGLYLVGGGGWYVANLWMYGSPVFPAEVALGKWVIFKGAYGLDGIRLGEFHVSDRVALARLVVGELGWATVAVVVAGLAGLALMVWQSRERRLAAGLLLVLSVIWFYFYAKIVPHNSQTRFLFPALLGALAGFAWLVGRIRGGRARYLIYTAIWGLFAWRWLDDLKAAMLGLNPAIPAALLTLGLLVYAGWRLRMKLERRVPGTILAAVCLVSAWMFTDAAAIGMRQLSFAKADFAAWMDVYLPFNHPDCRPAVIAYTGLNIPYALTGPRFCNKVVYVNVQGKPEDGLYDFWKTGRKRYGYYRLGLYRDRPDFHTWRRNLSNARAGLLVVFRLHTYERAYLDADSEGFPIEDYWARGHPDIFKPLLTARFGRVYQINSAGL